MTLTGWAADYAAELVSPLGDRWAHTQGVVRQAHLVAVILPPEEREVELSSLCDPAVREFLSARQIRLVNFVEAMKLLDGATLEEGPT